jgi:Domain of unknown function (DUF4290)
MKEYGSNIQKLADYLVTIEDREKRTIQAHVLIELMRQIHPNMRDGQDYSQKLWDDLYIMAGFRLEVASAFTPPAPESVGKRPMQVPYTQKLLKYKQYGKNILVLIDKAVNVVDKDEKLAFVSYLIKLMKTFYGTWNRDNPDENVVFMQLEEMSEGRLRTEINHIRQNGLIDANPRDKSSNQDRSRSQSNGGQRNFGQNRNNGGSNNSGSSNSSNNNRGNNIRNQNSGGSSNNSGSSNGGGSRERDRDRFKANTNNRKRR